MFVLFLNVEWRKLRSWRKVPKLMLSLVRRFMNIQMQVLRLRNEIGAKPHMKKHSLQGNLKL